MYNEIQELLEDLTNQRKSLSSCLMDAKAIAHKLEDHKFMQWADSELTGYETDDVPDYRQVPWTITCTISNDVYTHSHWPLPTSHLDTEIRQKLETCFLKYPVKTLEDISRFQRLV